MFAIIFGVKGLFWEIPRGASGRRQSSQWRLRFLSQNSPIQNDMVSGLACPRLKLGVVPTRGEGRWRRHSMTSLHFSQNFPFGRGSTRVFKFDGTFTLLTIGTSNSAGTLFLIFSSLGTPLRNLFYADSAIVLTRQVGSI